MPIDNDSLFKSVQFRYRNERDPEFVLVVEYHQTDDFGPTITIHNLETGPLSLPFSAFSDTVEAVRGEGGGPPALRTPVVPSGKPSGSTTRLMPTRVASSSPVQPKRPAPVAPKRPAPPQQQYAPDPQEEYEQQQYVEAAQQNSIYGDQHTILQSDGVVESFHAVNPPARPKPKPQQPQPVRPPQEIPASLDMGGDFVDEELPPEMSLRNGRAKRDAVERGEAGIKRIKKLFPKPGDRDYAAWVAKQQDSPTEHGE